MTWPLDALRRQLDALRAGLTVEVMATVDSTNTELMRRTRAGRAEPTLLVAERQTAGRGRLGRPWRSQPGNSLTFSLGLPLAPPDWSGLSLAVGASVAQALHPRVELKWPNDLWVDGRKLGGILVETASFAYTNSSGRYAVIGVGVNVAAVEAHGLSTPPAALRQLCPRADVGDTLLRLVPPLLGDLQAFERFGFAPFQARYEARDVLRERPVILSDGTHGTAHGVTEQGALLVHTARGMVTVTSSEVSVRPAGTN